MAVSVKKRPYLYFVGAGGFLKCGVSHHPVKRMQEMQTGCPYPLELLAVIPYDTREDAYAAEKLFRTSGISRHYRGEWYVLTAQNRRHLAELSSI